MTTRDVMDRQRPNGTLTHDRRGKPLPKVWLVHSGGLKQPGLGVEPREAAVNALENTAVLPILGSVISVSYTEDDGEVLQYWLDTEGVLETLAAKIKADKAWDPDANTTTGFVEAEPEADDEYDDETTEEDAA
jgi:hypothetical protein